MRDDKQPRDSAEDTPHRGHACGKNQSFGSVAMQTSEKERHMGRGTLLFRASLGDVLRAERMRQGMTLRELSSLARVSLGYISEIERGQKEASSELLASLCSALAPLFGNDPALMAAQGMFVGLVTGLPAYAFALTRRSRR